MEYIKEETRQKLNFYFEKNKISWNVFSKFFPCVIENFLPEITLDFDEQEKIILLLNCESSIFCKIYCPHKSEYFKKTTEQETKLLLELFEIGLYPTNNKDLKLKNFILSKLKWKKKKIKRWFNNYRKIKSEFF